MRIENHEDLATVLGAFAGTESAISKAVYKGTNCGAWATVFPAHETWDGKLESAGVSFGSIVEGVDDCTQVYTVHFPCDEKEIWHALDNVEEEAEEIWNRTHGCSACWDGQTVYDEWGNEAGPEDYGMRPVDPECPECKGQGIVI